METPGAPGLGCLLMPSRDETQTKLDSIIIVPSTREQAGVLGRVGSICVGMPLLILDLVSTV